MKADDHTRAGDRAVVARADREHLGQALWDHSPVAILLTSPDGRILAANPTACRMFGRTEAELCRGGRAGLLDRSDPRLAAALAERTQTGRTQQVLNFLRADGSRFPGEVTSVVFTDHDGQTRTSMLILDITARQQAEEQLHASTERFETTFRQAAVGLGMVAPDGRWLRVNAKLCDILGYAPEELRARTLPDVTHPADLPAHRAGVRRMLAREIPSESCEQRCLRRDGQAVWVNLTIAPTWQPDGAPDYFIAVVEDIQARRAAEAALRESEANLNEARRLAGLGHWKWDLRTGVHTWSEDIYHMYGRDPALPPAVYPEVQQYFTPESWAHLAAAVEQGLAAGVPYECDAEVVRPDGTHRWITARGAALRDAAGQIMVLYGTVQDITARKQAEDEIRHLNESLERRVQERTAELQAANRELDSFAYAVSHDLRAPLRALSGFSHALQEDFGPKLTDEAHVYLEQIVSASRRMGELIDGLLALSRSTRTELRRDDVDLTAIAGRLRDELAQPEPGRQVAWRIAPGLRARGDARMLEAALRNLLGNAWKYTSKTPQAVIEVGRLDGAAGPGPAAGAAPLATFFVRDNGVGFDMAYAAKLFQPFQRLHRQDEFPGIGIGLATTERIIRRHGGEIRAMAEPGRGATFSFSLPPGEMEPRSAP